MPNYLQVYRWARVRWAELDDELPADLKAERHPPKGARLELPAETIAGDDRATVEAWLADVLASRAVTLSDLRRFEPNPWPSNLAPTAGGTGTVWQYRQAGYPAVLEEWGDYSEDRQESLARSWVRKVAERAAAVEAFEAEAAAHEAAAAALGIEPCPCRRLRCPRIVGFEGAYPA